METSELKLRAEESDKAKLEHGKIVPLEPYKEHTTLVHKESNTDREKESVSSKKGSMIRSGVIFLALIGLTFYMLFRNQDVSGIIASAKQAKVEYLLIGLLCMCTFTVCEGLNIRRGLSLFGYKVGVFQSIKYGIVGFFFSSITPSATGGQPLQLYYMHKDNLNVSHSSLALLIELASYQVVTIGYALVGFAYQWKFLTNTVGNVKYLLAVGIVLNLILLLLVGCAIFSKKIIQKIVNACLWVLKKCKVKKWLSYKHKSEQIVEEYQSSAKYFKENKKIMGKMLVTSFVQITALHSIPFWIYCAFGLQGFSIVDVITLQAILFIAVSVLPLPGTVGVSESGFLLLFKTLFPAGLLSSAMLLSRGISFYVFVALTGSILIIDYLRKNILQKRKR